MGGWAGRSVGWSGWVGGVRTWACGSDGEAGRRQRAGQGQPATSITATSARTSRRLNCLLPSHPLHTPTLHATSHREVLALVVGSKRQVQQAADCVEEGLAGAQVLGAARHQDAVDRLRRGRGGSRSRGRGGEQETAGTPRPRRLASQPASPQHTLNRRSTSSAGMSQVMGTARAPALSTSLTYEAAM